jgi:hypothetical protein
MLARILGFIGRFLIGFIFDCVQMSGTLLMVIIALFLPFGVYFAFHSTLDLVRGASFWEATNIGFSILFFGLPILLMVLVITVSLITERNAK